MTRPAARKEDQVKKFLLFLGILGLAIAILMWMRGRQDELEY